MNKTEITDLINNELLHTKRLVKLAGDALRDGDMEMAASRARYAIMHLETFISCAHTWKPYITGSHNGTS